MQAPYSKLLLNVNVYAEASIKNIDIALGQAYRPPTWILLALAYPTALVHLFH
jgi:hypothetical protein